MSESGSTAPAAAAGWYPDPEQAESLRYWDGERWTEQRAPAAPVDPTSSLGPRVVLAMLGGAIAVIGTFLPRADSSAVLSIADNTLMQSGDGLIFVLFAVGGVTAVYRNAQKARRSAAAIFLGLLIVVLAYTDGHNPQIVNGLGEQVDASVGVGVWAVGVGGLLITLAGSALLADR
jgi:hypothetical protein